jgi:hypothetical protein
MTDPPSLSSNRRCDPNAPLESEKRRCDPNRNVAKARSEDVTPIVTPIETFPSSPTSKTSSAPKPTTKPKKRCRWRSSTTSGRVISSHQMNGRPKGRRLCLRVRVRTRCALSHRCAPARFALRAERGRFRASRTQRPRSARTLALAPNTHARRRVVGRGNHGRHRCLRNSRSHPRLTSQPVSLGTRRRIHSFSPYDGSRPKAIGLHIFRR